MFRRFLPTHDVDAVLIAANWDDDETDIDKLDMTIAHVHRYTTKVVVFGPIIRYEDTLPHVLATALLADDPSYAARRRKPGIGAIDDRIRDIARANGASYVSIYRTMCPDGSCETSTPDGMPLQFDAEHLTAEGSIRLARAWQAAGALP
jgi:hypothetical protein